MVFEKALFQIMSLNRVGGIDGEPASTSSLRDMIGLSGSALTGEARLGPRCVFIFSLSSP
jgi:hypothetical protein